MKDFALSMVASADMNHINKLLDRVDVLDDNPDLKDQRVTFEVGLLAIQRPSSSHHNYWAHYLIIFKLLSGISGVQGIC